MNKKLQGNGHPEFYKMLEDMSDLHSRKNADYAEANKPLGNFERVADLCEKYKLFESNCPTTVKVATLYMLKQFDCFMNTLATNKELEVEGLDDRLQDICVYSVLIRILNKESKK